VVQCVTVWCSVLQCAAICDMTHIFDMSDTCDIYVT